MNKFTGPPPVAPEHVPTPDELTWGLLAHLSSLLAGLLGVPFAGPLVVWLVKKDTSVFVADQAKEALNFQLSVLIVVLVTALTCIGAPVAIVAAVGGLIYPIIGAMAANKGEYYRYPYTFRLIS